MAGLQSMKVLKNLKEGALQCSLCLELMKDPRVLNCLHRFCCHCLDEFCLKGKSPGSLMSCPCCRQKTKVPAGGAKMFKSDFLLRDILENVQVKDDVLSGQCGSCGNTGELSRFCKTCQCVICGTCVAQHGKMKILQNHSLETLGSQHVSQATPQDKHTMVDAKKCSIHRDETVNYQCESCDDTMICNTCLNSFHRGHVTKSLHDVMTELRNSIKEELKVTSDNTANYNEALILIKAKRQAVSLNVQQAKTSITTIRKEMIESIERQATELAQTLNEKAEMLVSAFTSMEDILQKDLSRLSDIRQKASGFLLNSSSDMPTVLAGREYLNEMKSPANSACLPPTEWIKKQEVQFCPSGAAPSIGTIHSHNAFVKEFSWNVGLIHDKKDAITAMETLPSGKLLLAIARETQATYAIISTKDGSLGWRKNFSIQNFPPYTPCYATSLEKNAIIMAWRHVITRYDMLTNRSSSYGMKIPTGAIVQSISADDSDERIIVTHSSKNELRLFDGELYDAREITVGYDYRRIKNVSCHTPLGTYLLCDDHGDAFSVDKYSGKKIAQFYHPSVAKTVKIDAKAICGSKDGSVFVLWSSSKVAQVIQYLSCGIPVSRINIANDTSLITLTTRNDKEYIIACCPSGKFDIYGNVGT